MLEAATCSMVSEKYVFRVNSYSDLLSFGRGERERVQLQAAGTYEQQRNAHRSLEQRVVDTVRAWQRGWRGHFAQPRARKRPSWTTEATTTPPLR